MKKATLAVLFFILVSILSTNVAQAGECLCHNPETEDETTVGCTSCASGTCPSGWDCQPINVDPTEGGTTPAEGGTTPAGGGSVGGSATQLNNPLTGNASAIGIPQLVKKITTTALGLTGVLALLAFIYGGLLWMISGGDSGKVTKGKNTMVWAIAGLLVIFCSYAIIKLVFEALGVTS